MNKHAMPIGYTTLVRLNMRTGPNISERRVLTIPEGADVFFVSEEDDWTEVDYKNHVGYVYSAGLEKLLAESNVVHIPDGIRTPSRSDAQQYILIDGVKHLNLCGPFCAGFCAGIGILPTLTAWEQKAKQWYDILFRKDYGMGIGEVERILTTLLIPYKRMKDVHRDKVLGVSLYSPQLIKKELDLGNNLIIGCRISNAGYLTASRRIGHWVTVTDILPAGDGGTVFYYDPFSNARKSADWSLFWASANAFEGGVTGTYAERDEVIEAPDTCEDIDVDAIVSASVGEVIRKIILHAEMLR